MSKRKTRKLTRRQQKLVEGIIARKSGARAARDADYSPDKPENERQSAYQTMQRIGERAREAMDRHGLDLDELIDKHLHPLLEARGTKFFPWRKTTKGKTEQIVDTREVAALAIRLRALDVAFRLRCDYAPKELEIDPETPVPIRVINTSAIQPHG